MRCACSPACKSSLDGYRALRGQEQISYCTAEKRAMCDCICVENVFVAQMGGR